MLLFLPLHSETVSQIYRVLLYTMGSASRDTVKMLVLETDEPHPETMKHRGRFGEIIDRFFRDAGEAHDPPLSVETEMHFVVDDPVSLLCIIRLRH